MSPPSQSNATAPPVDALEDHLVAALQRGQTDRAEQLLAERTTPLPQDLLVPVAELHLERGRYGEAVRLLNRVIDRTPITRILTNLAKNLRALQTHRPAVCEHLTGADLDPHRFQIAESAEGLLTITANEAGGKPVSLSPDNRPSRGARDALAQLESAIRDDQCVALCGIGDGYLLAELAQLSPEPVLGRELNVHLIEPDVPLLRTVLMLHDLSGANGPIARGRFRWWVGEDWAPRMHQAVADNPYIPVPAVHVRQGLNPEPIVTGIERIVGDLSRDAVAMQKRIDAHYAQVSRDQLVPTMRGEGDRKPRILLLTTRFSTVLQYSTADTAAAFEQLGWETEMVIEPDRDHRTTIGAVREALDRFKPDLVFQIDHLRSEYPGPLFPDNLPFICWIQDNLTQLTRAEAGRSVGTSDFVIGTWVEQYIQKYRFPRPQCIVIPRLTRTSARSAANDRSAEDLVYISNHGPPPERRLEALVDPAAESERSLLKGFGEALIDTYRTGDSVATLPELQRRLEAFAGTRGIQLTDERLDRLSGLLHEQLNNLLYRQQGVGWVVAVAQRLGLSVGLYGRGWEANPAFADHARGTVVYGEPLDRLTAAARFNLRLEPFFAISHQRLLDGLASGGFFLSRRHVTDDLNHRWARWMDRLPRHVQTIAETRRALSAETFGQLRELHAAYQRLSSQRVDDPIALYREAEQQNILCTRRLPPDYERIAFTDEAELEQRVRHFLDHPEQRGEIAGRQRDYVRRHFTYAGGMRRVIRTMADRIAGEVGGETPSSRGS